MADIAELMKLMANLKEVEAELKLAIAENGSLDRLTFAASKLHYVVKGLEKEYWQAIEEIR